MRDFLIQSAPVLIWVIALAEAAICVLAARLSARLKGTPEAHAACRMALLTALVAAGLAIDAFIQALGSVIGFGSFLQGLSQIRYILHGVLIPLLLPISFYFITSSKKILSVVWVITGILIILGIVMGLSTKTEPAEFAGILRYATSDETPAIWSRYSRILSVGGVFPLLILGIIGWVRKKGPRVFLAGLFMFAFAALGPATSNMDLNFLITLFGELLMVLFLYLASKHEGAHQGA